MLSFNLLGHVLLSKDGKPLTQFRSQKEAALLIYLAQTGQAQQRDVVADLLWDANSTSQSLSNLRTALSRLRKQVGDVFVASRKTLAPSPEIKWHVDSAELMQTLSSIRRIDTAEKAKIVQEALDAYRGDFLDDFYLTDAPRFTEWMTTTRENIRRQVIDAYHKLGDYALSTGDIDYGLKVADGWLQIDELDEDAHHLRIKLLLEADKKADAAKFYEQYADLLNQELGIPPSQKLTSLIQNVLSDSFTVPAVTPVPTAPPVQHNLPAAYDQFLGRKAVQQEIHIRFDQPWCRLVTLRGQGGVGKTRLALEIARSRLSQYRDGVWFVGLADLDANDDDLNEAVAVEIATVLHLRLTGSAPLKAQLLDYLRQKQMLLVLDNFEHLREGKQIVLDIVRSCENVQMLVTSRESLQMRAEWIISLNGLNFPSSDEDESHSEAVELFLTRRAQQEWRGATQAELRAIRAICRMVGGLPLAIELAVAQTRHSSVLAIASKLQENFDALRTLFDDTPDRHQSMKIVFDMSWDVLSPALQERLARLSVFRGTFTETAASQVAQAEMHHLSALIEKSLLVHHIALNRYGLHPVIRAYAAQKLPVNDGVKQEHARFYLSLLAHHAQPLLKDRPQESMVLLEDEFENIRKAWQTGLAERRAEWLLPALPALSTFYQLHGWSHEGESVMHQTRKEAMGWANGRSLAMRAGLEQARFQNRLGRYRLAVATIKTVLKVAEGEKDPWVEGMAHVWWGEALWRLGEYETAVTKLNHARHVGQLHNDPMILGWAHHQLGIVYDITGKYQAAQDHLEKACQQWRAIDHVQALSNTLNSIGLVHYHKGSLKDARNAFEQALEICNQTGNRHLQALLLNNLSIMHTEQGDYLGAKYYLQLSLNLAAASNNLTGQGEIYANLGRNFRLLGDVEQAVRSLEQGLSIARETENRSLMATTLIQLAKTKQANGEEKQAEKLFIKALEIARQDTLSSIECEALICLGDLLSQQDVEQARAYSYRAVSLARTLQNPNLLKQASDLDHYLSMVTDSQNVNQDNFAA
jgi:predicted ATPase/DNA-binding SARP family transcriptional activator/Tfp pilus assembly protein PilF